MPVRARRLAVLLIALVTLGFLVWEGVVRHEREKRVSISDEVYQSPPALDVESLSGYRLGMRHEVIAHNPDDMHWIVNTQRVFQDGTFRLRTVDYDNTPIGRELHWSTAYSMWIRALARIEEVAFGRDGPRSIESAARYANLAAAAAAALFMIVAAGQIFGARAAGLAALGFWGMLPFRDTFLYGVGDHHAITSSCIMISIFGFAAGIRAMVRSDDVWAARWIGLSALAGSAGFWINAVSLIPALAGLHLAAGWISWIQARQDAGRLESLAPLWRLWSRFGGAACILFYLIEYAPSHLGWRLEVNHPLYALAWFGGGELLAQWVHWLARRSGRPPRVVPARIVLGIACVAAVPLAIVLFRDAVYLVADPFLMAVHERFIMEFRSLAANLELLPPLRAAAMCLPLALVPLAIAIGVSGSVPAHRRVLVLTVLCPVAFMLALSLWQARWWGPLAAASIPLGVVVVYGVLETPRQFALRRFAPWLAFAALAPGAVISVSATIADLPPSRKEWLGRVERGVAQYLRERMGESRIVALASPDATSSMLYYGGIHGVGTFYWENRDGLKRAAEMFSASNSEAALRLFEAAGITHLVLYSWGGFEKEFLELYREFEGGASDPDSSILMQIVRERRIPPWLRPIPFRMPQVQELEGEVALIFEVVAPQSSDAITAEQFDFAMEMGWTHSAQALESALLRASDHLPSLVALARLYALRGDAPRLLSILEAIDGRGATDDELSIEDRIQLAGVYAVAGEREKALSQFSLVLERLDLKAASSLFPETAALAIRVGEWLEVPVPRGATLEKVMRMLPPHLKAAAP